MYKVISIRPAYKEHAQSQDSESGIALWTHMQPEALTHTGTSLKHNYTPTTITQCDIANVFNKIIFNYEWLFF